jgi:hypothetical protein
VLIFRAVSRLPSNTRETRLEVYNRARKTLAAHPMAKREVKRELRALEWAIRDVERSPHEIPGTRGSTAVLILSIFFLKAIWAADPT